MLNHHHRRSYVFGGKDIFHNLDFKQKSLNIISGLNLHLTKCDQIWWNFATLAKFSESWAILWGLISYLGKFWANFGKFYMPFGKIVIDINGQMLKNSLAIWSFRLIGINLPSQLANNHNLKCSMIVNYNSRVTI